MTACGKEAESEKETETKVEESKKDSDTDDTEISTGTERPDKDDNETPDVDNSQNEQPDADKEPLSKVDDQKEQDDSEDSFVVDLSDPAYGTYKGKPVSEWTMDDFGASPDEELAMYPFTRTFLSYDVPNYVIASVTNSPNYDPSIKPVAYHLVYSNFNTIVEDFDFPVTDYMWKNGLTFGSSKEELFDAYGEPADVVEDAIHRGYIYNFGNYILEFDYYISMDVIYGVWFYPQDLESWIF